MVPIGLDQYLTARKYIRSFAPSAGYGDEDASKNLEELEAKAQYNHVLQVAGLKSLMLPADQREFGGLYVEVRVGYWRKANQIHAWFEKHLDLGTNAEGVKITEIKNVTDYDVSMANLVDLRFDCKQVLDTVVKGPEVADQWGNVSPTLEKIDAKLAMELLPPQQGFFFGDYELDIYYVWQLEDTVKQLDKIIGNPEFDKEVDLTYRAWW